MPICSNDDCSKEERQLRRGKCLNCYRRSRSTTRPRLVSVEAQVFVAQLRQTHGWKIKELGRAADLDEQTVSRIAKGLAVNPDSVDRIMAVDPSTRASFQLLGLGPTVAQKRAAAAAERRAAREAKKEAAERAAAGDAVPMSALDIELNSHSMTRQLGKALEGAVPVIEDDEDEWQAQSVCRETDPEIFFPEKGGSTREAKAVCESCPVKDPCLQMALANDERFGIWGGLSERERRKLKINRLRTHR